MHIIVHGVPKSRTGLSDFHFHFLSTGCPLVKTSPSNIGFNPRSGVSASQPKNQSLKQKQYCNKFNKDFKKF